MAYRYTYKKKKEEDKLMDINAISNNMEKIHGLHVGEAFGLPR